MSDPGPLNRRLRSLGGTALLLAGTLSPFVALPVAARATSFSCSAARTPQEKAICSDKSLSALDDQVAAAYKAIRDRISPSAASEIQADQRDWLRWLGTVCSPEAVQAQGDPSASVVNCLAAEYRSRLRQLGETGSPHLGSVALITRLRVLTAPNKQPPIPGSPHPAFGVGRISWLEIDHPTPQQVGWNKAVLAEAIRMSKSGEEHPDTSSFNPASIADSEVEVSCTLLPSNDALLQAKLVNSTFGYGAAHPNDYDRSIAWWLKEGRAVTPQDIFRPGGTWQTFVARRAYAKLKADSDMGGAISPQAEFLKAAAPITRDPHNWSLDQQGLELSFPVYSVGPRVIGAPTVKLTWTDLKPYLAAGFDPARLPEPVKKP